MSTETSARIDEILSEINAKGKVSPETAEDLRNIPRKAPPRRGMCRRCGENKPVNRLMLCYPCWVKTNLEERGWREGMPHPDWCQCSLGGHGRKSEGN
jgi:hypothetical protein